MPARDIKEYYEKKLEGELHAEEPEQREVSYSRAYQIFKQEQAGKIHTFYERACRLCSKFLRVSIPAEKRDELARCIDLAHLNITPESAYAFAYFVTTALALVSIFIFALTINPLILVFGMMASILCFFYLPNIPKSLYEIWRSKASDQLLLAVLYMVIYMKREPNLEQATLFVARHLAPPLSLDFIKVLWQFETGTYSTVADSLNAYVETWRGKEDDFIEAIHLIQASLYEPDQEKIKQLLEEATNVILEGTQDHMIHYAHSLQSPVQTLHMLGIVLPVLGMVLLPMTAAFMGSMIKAHYLIILYNVVLPLVVYLFARSILSTRPGGAAAENITTFKLAQSRPYFQLGGTKIYAPAGLLSFLIFIAFLLPISVLTLFFINQVGLEELIYSNALLYLSIFGILGAAVSIAFYYWYSVRHVVSIQQKTAKVEDEFSGAVFQLGNRLQQNVPAELAFSELVVGTKGTEISNFFDIIDRNMREQGLSLKDAIFNSKVGALRFYPSPTIKSVMHLFIEGVRKSPQVAADSLITISRYMQNVHRVIERLKDLLADTLSSMEMQANFFASLIAGIVVSLAVLITQILLALSQKMGELTSSTAAMPEGAGFIMPTFFQVKEAIPPYLFQLIVGVYIIQIVIILSILLSDIINGQNAIERRWTIAQTLFKATAVYFITTLVASVMFSRLAETVTGIVV